jgi:hypothetical protein
LAQRLASQVAPYRRYGPQCHGYAGSVKRAAHGTKLGDDQLPFGVEQQVLSINAERE